MKIAVTGTSGQLATALMVQCPPGQQLVLLGRPQLDLTDLASIAPALGNAAPDLVVSAAAYTAVDRAESDHEAAFAINAAGAGQVARVAHDLGVPLLHLSTDYVFDGTKPAPYIETDPVAPLGVYGASKQAGEDAVLAAHPGAVILRTAWVYSPFGQNFVKTMLHLAQSRSELGVVADQIGNPTSALDMADGIWAIAAQLCRQPHTAQRRIYHMAGHGDASWADLAEAIFAASAALGGPVAQVRRIGTSAYPTPAARPANSRLDCDALAKAYGVRLPHWRASVAQVVAQLLTQPAKDKDTAA